MTRVRAANNAYLSLRFELIRPNELDKSSHGALEEEERRSVVDGWILTSIIGANINAGSVVRASVLSVPGPCPTTPEENSKSMEVPALFGVHAITIMTGR